MQEIEKGFEVDKDLRKKIQREIIFSNISANQRRQNAWLF
jgi:hypothetical protein